LVSLSLFALARPAHAQTHWDLNVHAGIARRFFNTTLPEGGTLGPIVGLSGDFALLPLVRLGAYADYEYAYTGEAATPSIISGGLRVKLEPPVNFRGVHPYAFAGFGVAYVSAPAYDLSVGSGQLQPGSQPGTATATATSGTVLELPIGAGLAWRFRRPWELFVEVQGRVGLDSEGDYFSANGRPISSATYPNHVPGIEVIGTESFALMATVGIGFDD
jgi:hypothetical protein